VFEGEERRPVGRYLDEKYVSKLRGFSQTIQQEKQHRLLRWLFRCSKGEEAMKRPFDPFW
jgi:hypothetical protein